MKQYIIIALCIIGGKYVDLPIWLNVLLGMSAFWTISQIENIKES